MRIDVCVRARACVRACVCVSCTVTFASKYHDTNLTCQ